MVPDVEVFPGHIACDGDSKSEIVVPIFDLAKDTESGVARLVGIIDVDCRVRDGFDDIDVYWREYLQ